ncbi:hypothetical protein C2E23DRAFT_840279 [Lenzites betulinus]|nr:hypothetical protein C2E23DRAFT_840279 [Lenzites betulinus]
MPPKGPLPDILVSGRPTGRSEGYRILTPRTPHSRAGRAEEGFTEVELQEYQDDEANAYRTDSQQQSQPLLTASVSRGRAPGYRSRGDDEARTGGSKSFLKKLPLLGGSVLAVVVLVLFVISVNRPGALEAAFLQAPEVFFQTDEPYVQDGAHTARPIYTPSPMPLPSPSIVETRPPPDLLISYENYTSFPLTGAQYRHECAKLMSGFMHHGAYWDVPPMGANDVVHHDDVTNYHMHEGQPTRVCTSTVTYLLDGHVGLMADLALMAQAAAHAREHNRTFFVDDTHWNRGKWTDHFQPVEGRELGPEPGCLPPPREELVACPRTARHWVISSRTAKYHMGHSFSEEYEDPFGHNIQRLRPIYERALKSFEEVIRPNAHMAALIRSARAELTELLSIPPLAVDEPTNDSAGSQHKETNAQQMYIGAHIRKGDRVPGGYMFYPDKQVPLDNYVTGVRSTWDRLYGSTNASTSQPATPSPPRSPDVSSGRPDHYPAPPITWLASDSPAAAREFVAAFPPATAVFSLEHNTDPALRALAPKHDYVQAQFDDEPAEERVRLTRGMIVDFAMLSGMWAWPGEVLPAAVVCGIGSNVCRSAALGFGFDRAFGFDDDGDYTLGEINRERRRWVDVDVDGKIEPAWVAFEFH